MNQWGKTLLTEFYLLIFVLKTKTIYELTI